MYETLEALRNPPFEILEEDFLVREVSHQYQEMDVQHNTKIV